MKQNELVQDMNNSEETQDEELGWEDVQEELEKGKGSSLPNMTKQDDELGWDDVMSELDEEVPMNSKEEISMVKFSELKKNEKKEAGLDLDFIMDIPLTVSVEIGRGRMLISELLQLGQGSIVELTKIAGEPIDVFINNRLIARGEVVVVNEKFGVRLTDVISPAERINNLK